MTLIASAASRRMRCTIDARPLERIALAALARHYGISEMAAGGSRAGLWRWRAEDDSKPAAVV